MDFFREHILSFTLFFPLVGIIAVLLPKKDETVRWVANIWSFLGFLFSLPLVFWFDKNADGMQFQEKASWIPSIGATYHLGIEASASC
jgi:NADH-quinone oxidoreductase subunit M